MFLAGIHKPLRKGEIFVETFSTHMVVFCVNSCHRGQKRTHSGLSHTFRCNCATSLIHVLSCSVWTHHSACCLLPICMKWLSLNKMGVLVGWSVSENYRDCRLQPPYSNIKGCGGREVRCFRCCDNQTSTLFTMLTTPLKWEYAPKIFE